MHEKSPTGGRVIKENDKIEFHDVALTDWR